MSERKVKTVAVGLGNRTCKYLTYLIRHQELAELVAVVDTDASKVRKAREMLSLPDCPHFETLDALLSAGTEADACIIGTPDTSHYDLTVKALKAGWHVLLEKPMGQTEEQCRNIVRLSRETGRMVAVCYVLRYHPYFIRLKELTGRTDIGKIRSVIHTENVGIDRTVHTFVRGPWNRAEMNTSVFFTKCCHDVDFVLWLAGADVKEVVTKRGTKEFRPESAPVAAASRCLDCGLEKSCRYSAVDLYLRRKDWVRGFDMLPGENQEEAIIRILKESRYGRCVYDCPKNDVIDSHTVSLEMESGVSATIMMKCLTENTNRETIIDCENAVIRGDETVIEVKFKDGSEPEMYDFGWTKALGFHAEADFNIVKDFIETIKDGRTQTRTGCESAILSHLICLSAE